MDKSVTTELSKNRIFIQLITYSDVSFIQTRLFPIEIFGLTSFLDYWIKHSFGRESLFPQFLSGLARFPDYRSPD